MELRNFKVAALSNWDKNPRAIKEADLDRLCKQIKKLGVYKPLLVTPEGIVLGGNMRLHALRKLKVDEVPCSIVHPKNDADRLAYALSDNDRAGYYEDQALAELVVKIKLPDQELFNIDIGHPVSLPDVMQYYGPGPEPVELPIDQRAPDEKPNTERQDGLRRIEFYFSTPDYTWIMEHLPKALAKWKAENTSELLKQIVKDATGSTPPEA